MKKNLFSIIGALTISLCAVNLQAQTDSPTLSKTVSTTNAPNGIGPLDSFGIWLQQADTGLGTFSDTNKNVSVEIGACFENNINADAALRVAYRVWRHVEVESVTRIWNSTQTIKSQQIGGGIALPMGDLQVSADIGGGYQFEAGRMFGYAALTLAKGVSQNNYVATRIETDVYNGTQHPFYGAFFGRKF